MNQYQIEKAKSVDLIDLVIANNYPYKKASNHIKILCPFHHEKTPSLAIYEHSFYCYSCGEGGDVVGWVMKIYKKEFIDAVKILLKYNERNR